MKLTRTEADILLHRLECPEHIAECVGGDADEVVSCVAGLAKQVASKSLPDTLDATQVAVVIDCLEGSTYATVEDEASPAARRAVLAGRALCRKLEPLLDRLVEFPTY